MNKQKARKMIEDSKHIVFMTGAGVSVPSGIPDYRSMDGVYQGIKRPEYLLSSTCLRNEPDVFYSFVSQLYQPDAKPNVIHYAMKELADKKDVKIITQNIDDLHFLAGSQEVVPFHGSLYDCYCQLCNESVTSSEYIASMYHTDCGGIIRPNVVLYEEGLPQSSVETSIKWIEKADLIVIVGTSFQVYPFSGLLQYKQPATEVIVVNKESIALNEQYVMVEMAGEEFFKSEEE